MSCQHARHSLCTGRGAAQAALQGADVEHCLSGSGLEGRKWQPSDKSGTNTRLKTCREVGLVAESGRVDRVACCLRWSHVRPGRRGQGLPEPWRLPSQAAPPSWKGSWSSRSRSSLHMGRGPQGAPYTQPSEPNAWPGSRGPGLSTDRYTASRTKPTSSRCPWQRESELLTLGRRGLDLGSTAV